MPTTLPQPDSISQAQCEKLSAVIRKKIHEKGSMPFVEYMKMALYEPGLGYYSAGSEKLGASGDFITAPEYSDLFSLCIADQCRQVLSDLNGGDVLEFGAGSGRMAVAILRELERVQQLPNHYFILEVSADLRARQQAFLQNEIPELFDRIRWLDALPEKPLRGVIVANEVLDAMPVHKFAVTEEGVREYHVINDEERFDWKLVSIKDEKLNAHIRALDISSQQYESEINLLLEGWIASVSNCLDAGIILLADYGFPRHEYYHPQRDMGTLMCHFRHHAHSDPLILTGIQDITSHVDFTAVAEAATRNKLMVAGFTHQAGFLINCGITDRLIQCENENERIRLNQQLKRLTMPNEMGEFFKVMALTRDYDAELIGFCKMNQLGRL